MQLLRHETMAKHILEQSLGYMVGRAARSLGTKLNRNFAEAGFDVTCEQWSVLANLFETNGQSQQELAGTTCKDKTSMTRLLDNMENHNLVVRVPSKEDKRQKLIYLTPKGQKFRIELLKIVKLTLEQAQKLIPIKDLETCKRVLKRVYENTK
jgi:DNA-binding MarR family transcriptional regulator